MKRAAQLIVATLPAMLFAAPAVWGQTDSGARLVGSGQLGYRYVDVRGRTEKYREDINLDDGARLFKLDLEFVPPTSLRGSVDKIKLQLQNFGGDPFETFRAVINKHGRYRLKYDRRKSNYFYDDIILPSALADPELANAGDFHTFDFERVRDAASLELQLARSATLTFAFDGYTKKGRSTTTVDVERDEFELDRPIDERLNEYSATFQYAWKGATLVLEERIRDYRNSAEFFLPGRSLGEDPEDPTTLDFFFLDSPYELTSFSHTARVIAHPGERLTFQAAATLDDMNLDVVAAERSEGTDFEGLPFSTDLDGEGQVKRDMSLVDLDVSYLIDERFALLGGFRRHERTQRGGLSLDPDTGFGEWEIDNTSFDAGLRVHATRSLTLGGGFRHQTRNVAFAWDSVQAGEQAGNEEQVETSGNGYFLSFGWRSPRKLRLRAGYEDSRYDGPFTFKSPTDKRIFRVRGQYGGGEGFSISLSYRMTRSENDESDWRAHYDTLNGRLGYRVASFSTSIGYSRVAIERSIDQLVVTLPGFQGGIETLVPVAYDIRVNSFDGRLIWSFVEGWRLGGQVRLYESKGSWDVERVDLRGWLEVELGRRYVAHLGVRDIDYQEPVRGFNDYEASIVEMSLGYRW